LAVVARCLRGDCLSEIVMGNCRGKRFPVRTSATAVSKAVARADLDDVIICA
jgi:hypothetical protein